MLLETQTRKVCAHVLKDKNCNMAAFPMTADGVFVQGRMSEQATIRDAGAQMSEQATITV